MHVTGVVCRSHTPRECMANVRSPTALERGRIFEGWFTFENCVADSTRRQFQCCISTHGRIDPHDSRYTTVSALAGHDHAKPTTPNNRRHMSRVCQRALDIFDAASRMNAHLHRALPTTGPDLVRHSSRRRLAQRSWSLSMVHHDRYRTLHCAPPEHMSRLSSRTGTPFSREQARIRAKAQDSSSIKVLWIISGLP